MAHIAVEAGEFRKLAMLLRSSAFAIERMCDAIEQVSQDKGWLPDVPLVDLPLSLVTRFSVRTQNLCKSLGAMTLRHLSTFTEAELRDMRNCGELTIQEIKRELAKHELTLKAVRHG